MEMVGDGDGGREGGKNFTILLQGESHNQGSVKNQLRRINDTGTIEHRMSYSMYPSLDKSVSISERGLNKGNTEKAESSPKLECQFTLTIFNRTQLSSHLEKPRQSLSFTYSLRDKKQM